MLLGSTLSMRGSTRGMEPPPQHERRVDYFRNRKKATFAKSSNAQLDRKFVGCPKTNYYVVRLPNVITLRKSVRVCSDQIDINTVLDRLYDDLLCFENLDLR